MDAAPGGPPPGYAPPPQPGYGPPPGSPPPGYAPQPGGQPYGQPPQGYSSYGPGTGGGVAFDLKRLTIADYVVAGGAILYLVWAVLPWWSLSYFGGGFSISGFDYSGLVTFSFVLLLLAAVWAVLPAFVDVKVGFPRAWITVGLAALAFLLTLIAWIGSLNDFGFSIWALLALVTAAAVTLFAFLRLLPEMRNRPALPGALGGAAQWANQQAPGRPGQSSVPPTQQFPVPPAPPPGAGGPAQGAPGAPGHAAPPPPYGQPGSPQPGQGPAAPGGDTPRPGGTF